MIVCRIMRLEKTEHGSLHEHCCTMGVSRIWMCLYVGGMREGVMNGGRMALSTHECMQHNKIGETGARELARALKQSTCITYLDVRVCWWEEGGCCASQQDGSCEHS